jgi:hypothetical protein
MRMRMRPPRTHAPPPRTSEVCIVWTRNTSAAYVYVSSLNRTRLPDPHAHAPSPHLGRVYRLADFSIFRFQLQHQHPCRLLPPLCTASHSTSASIRQHTLRIRCAYAAHTLRSIPAPPPSSLRSLPQHVSKDTSAYVSIRYAHCSHTLRSIPVPPPSLSAQPPTGMPPPHTSAYVSSIRIYVSIRCAAYQPPSLRSLPERHTHPHLQLLYILYMCPHTTHI